MTDRKNKVKELAEATLSFSDKHQVEAIGILLDSIDDFNRNSTKLSNNMIRIYWLQVLLIVIQIGIVLVQIFKWW